MYLFFLVARNFLLLQTIVLLFIFVGYVPVARIFLGTDGRSSDSNIGRDDIFFSKRLKFQAQFFLSRFDLSFF